MEHNRTRGEMVPWRAIIIPDPAENKRPRSFSPFYFGPTLVWSGVKLSRVRVSRNIPLFKSSNRAFLATTWYTSLMGIMENGRGDRCGTNESRHSSPALHLYTSHPRNEFNPIGDTRNIRFPCVSTGTLSSSMMPSLLLKVNYIINYYHIHAQ